VKHLPATNAKKITKLSDGLLNVQIDGLPDLKEL
jgi:hypothetical protein